MIADQFSLLQLPTVSSMGSEVGPFRTETGADCRDGEVRRGENGRQVGVGLVCKEESIVLIRATFR